MSINLSTPKTITQTANCYQITQINTTFYEGGGDMSSCTLSIRGRIGNGDGANFLPIAGDAGVLAADIKGIDVLTMLGTNVKTEDVGKPYLEVLLTLIDSNLRQTGVI